MIILFAQLDAHNSIFSLKARGLLVSKWGSGVFVTDRLQGIISSPWRQLVADHPDLRWDTLEFRRELEGATAHYAALRADKSDLKKIEGIIKRLNKAYDTGATREEHKADADFHEAIAEASHNSMFLYLHAGIWHAIRRRQPDAARQAMLAHIDFTRSELASRDI